MTLKELFPRSRRIRLSSSLPSRYSAWGTSEDVLEGPHGFVMMSPQGNFIDVIVDVTSERLKRRTETILNDPNYTLCSDGEYNFRLNLSDKFRCLQLVGLRPDRRG